MDPIFFKYQPNIGIDKSSFFKMKTGKLKIVWRKKVSNIDWWDDATKNFLFFGIFSSPLIIIIVERKNFRQKLDQYPINFPPSITIRCGRNKAGRNIIDINNIPVKKNNVNEIFLSILLKNYISSSSFCFLLIIWILVFLINNSAALGLRL